MEVIISSIITAAATILVGLIAYNFIMRKAVDDIVEIKKGVVLTKEELKNGKNDLQNEHSSLRNDHSGLKDDHARIIEKVDETKTVIFSLKDYIIESKATDAGRYANLTDKQKAISDSLSNLNSMMDEMKRLATENSNLKEKYNMLSAQNQYLTAENKLLKERIHHIDHESEAEQEY